MKNLGLLLASLQKSMPVEALTAPGCLECGDRGWVTVDRIGAGTVRRCACLDGGTIEEKLRKAGVPEADLFNLFNRPWRGHWPEAELAAWPRECCLTLLGGPGSGKTRVALELLRREVEAGRPVKFVTGEDLLSEAKERMSTPEGPEPYLRSLTEFRGTLALDDLWASQSTEYNDATISRVVRRRHSENRPQILTTNLTEADIELQEPRLASRIAGSVVLALADLDWRRMTARERKS